MGLFSVQLQNTAPAGDAVPYRTASFFHPSPALRYYSDWPGFPDAAQEGEFPDVNMLTGLVATGSPRSLNWLNEYLLQCPAMLGKIYFQTNDAGSFAYPVTVKTLTPFTDDIVVQSLSPAMVTNEYRNQGNEITMQMNSIMIGSFTWLEISVKNQSTLNINFEFSDYINCDTVFRYQINKLKNGLS